MTPLYKIPSGDFAGWRNESTGRLYDKDGNNVGYFKGVIAYSLSGYYIGEITMSDYIGKKTAMSYPLQSSLVPYVNVALAPFADRPGMSLAGWDEPDF